MTMPSVWSSVALATWSAAMLPEAPGLLSTTTGWPRALASGSAMVRAAMSGVEPPGKPTIRRIGLVGQAAPCAEAASGRAPVAKPQAAAIRRALLEGCMETRLGEIGERKDSPLL